MGRVSWGGAAVGVGAGGLCWSWKQKQRQRLSNPPPHTLKNQPVGKWEGRNVPWRCQIGTKMEVGRALPYRCPGGLDVSEVEPSVSLGF